MTRQDINTVFYSIPEKLYSAQYAKVTQGHEGLHAPSMLLTGKSIPVPNHSLGEEPFPNTQPKQSPGFEQSPKSVLTGHPFKFAFHGKHAQTPVGQVTTTLSELI